jgi:hypothetical protein
VTAQLQADLSAIISKRADCLRIQEAAAIADAMAELSRLSRVEQALRALPAKWRDARKGWFDPDDCASQLEAALSASPEAQPVHPFPDCTKGCRVEDGLLRFCRRHQPHPAEAQPEEGR